MTTSRISRRMMVLPHADGRLYEGIGYKSHGNTPVFLYISDAGVGRTTTDAIQEELGAQLAAAGYDCFALNGQPEQGHGDVSGRPSDLLVFLRGAFESFQLAFGVRDFAKVAYGRGAWGTVGALEESMTAQLVWIEAPMDSLEEMLRMSVKTEEGAHWVFAADRSSPKELRYIEGIVPASSTVLVPDADPTFRNGLRALGNTLVHCLQKNDGRSGLR